jgi:hypothetical protein
MLTIASVVDNIYFLVVLFLYHIIKFCSHFPGSMVSVDEKISKLRKTAIKEMIMPHATFIDYHEDEATRGDLCICVRDNPSPRRYQDRPGYYDHEYYVFIVYESKKVFDGWGILGVEDVRNIFADASKLEEELVVKLENIRRFIPGRWTNEFSEWYHEVAQEIGIKREKAERKKAAEMRRQELLLKRKMKDNFGL